MAVAMKKPIDIKMYSGVGSAGVRVKGYAVRYPDGSMSIFSPTTYESFPIDPSSLKECIVKTKEPIKESTFREH